MDREVLKQKVLIASFASLLCIGSVAAQVRKSNPSATPEEPPLRPLTDGERALNLKSIVANQPDFVADEVFFYSEGFGGFSAKRRVARKGDSYFIDTGQVKVITKPGKEIRLYDGSETYEENTVSSEFVLRTDETIDPKLLASQNGATFQALGTQTIDGHQCVKIEATLPDQKVKVFLYAAEDLKYLVIAAQVLDPPRGAIQRLQNISLDVPAALVEIPPSYHPIPKHKWSRVGSAKISYDGKPAKNFSVFRSDDGNQLFVTLYEPHPATGLLLPWHYSVFLKEQTVQIGFQGMLVTQDGKLAWDPPATEAFSSGDNTPQSNSYPCQGSKCPKTIVGTNSVEFPSVYYDDRKSKVRVSW